MDLMWNKVEKLLEELIENQKIQLLKCGQRIVPNLTSEDMLQPNDFLELENHPYFRYEEGCLAGMQTVQMALRALESINTDKKRGES